MDCTLLRFEILPGNNLSLERDRIFHPDICQDILKLLFNESGDLGTFKLCLNKISEPAKLDWQLFIESTFCVFTIFLIIVRFAKPIG